MSLRRQYECLISNSGSRRGGRWRGGRPRIIGVCRRGAGSAGGRLDEIGSGSQSILETVLSFGASGTAGFAASGVALGISATPLMLRQSGWPSRKQHRILFLLR